jgi:Holliday junction DNA helicase RuvA
VIGRLTGLLIEKRPPTVVLEVQGVGYEVDVPMSTFFHLPATGSTVTLQTHLIVREDAHLLFGFATDQERQAFRQLLKISGVGARTALSVLSGMSVAELQQAVVAHDGARLVKVPGIGKKTAERLLLELRDKLNIGVTVVVAGSDAESRSDAQHALLALGYSDKEATQVLGKIAPGIPVQEAIRQALKLLAKT